ncbi:acyltransferase [Agathobaculum sp. NTUH-O15-33]|uniref:acyltransferase family protein n=1 Tax=Agathobaculum sp. NTUH-O15-33 TaxID=3079302 RepID=UPI0029585C90|nr:acyltransferase [Agathobaculum sp. NTUH-O15-33]WNX85191.1 acyltransferase [Agathobaculum sp. NTUH-O15-33]
MRKHFIDNVRWLTVLLLFPYHTARIFDGVQPFYVKGAEMRAATVFVLACTPWFMPLLFVVAGISTRYALQKRSTGAYIRERFAKLFVPLISGTLLLVPMQTYFAEVFHNAYTGGYFGQYLLFFTKPTDLTGYTGGFTTGQLWFISYLFLISLIALPLIRLAHKRRIGWHDTPAALVLPLCCMILPFSYLLDIGGKSLGEYLVLFLLGYFVLAEEPVQAFTGRYRLALLSAGALLTAYTVVNRVSLKSGIGSRAIMLFTSWICILAILGMGRRHLNFQNKWTQRLSASSFPFYLFHQSIIVCIGFYCLQTDRPGGLQYALILSGSIVLSTLLYALCKRFRALRFLFAIKDTPPPQK